MTVSRIVAAAASALLVFGAGASARAGEAAAARGTQEATEAACKQDIETLCSGVKAGGAAIAKCLRQKRKDVSAGCKSAIKEEKAKRKTPRT